MTAIDKSIRNNMYSSTFKIRADVTFMPSSMVMMDVKLKFCFCYETQINYSYAMLYTS